MKDKENKQDYMATAHLLCTESGAHGGSPDCGSPWGLDSQGQERPGHLPSLPQLTPKQDCWRVCVSA